jgi:hypothetical protein
MKSFSDKLLENSMKIKDECDDLTKDVNILLKKQEKLPDDLKRDNYDRLMSKIDEKINDTSVVITNLIKTQNEMNKNFNESIACYNKIREVLTKDYTKVYNSARIGSLHALSLKVVRKHNIIPTDNTSAAVLEQSYRKSRGGSKSHTQKHTRRYKRK